MRRNPVVAGANRRLQRASFMRTRAQASPEIGPLVPRTRQPEAAVPEPADVPPHPTGIRGPEFKVETNNSGSTVRNALIAHARRSLPAAGFAAL